MLHDHTISLRGDMVAHKTSLTPSHFTEEPVARHEFEWLCVCVLLISTLSLSTISIVDFRTVPTVWYFRTVPTVWYFYLFSPFFN